jgi:hypothetical protein
VDLIVARKVNLAHGGPLVGMWDVPQLDEETVAVAEAFVDDFADLQRNHQAVQAHVAAWRRSHPTYRKHLRH